CRRAGPVAVVAEELHAPLSRSCLTVIKPIGFVCGSHRRCSRRTGASPARPSWAWRGQRVFLPFSLFFRPRGTSSVGVRQGQVMAQAGTRNWTRRRTAKRERLEAVRPFTSGRVLDPGRVPEALQALLRPGDRVALEGDNQKQADFLAAALAGCDP